MSAIRVRTSGKKLEARRNRRLLLLALVILTAAVANCLYGAGSGEGAAPQSAAGGDIATEAVMVADSPVLADGAGTALNPAVPAEAAVETAPAQVIPDIVIDRQIQPGDTLSAIFDSVSVGLPVLHQILAADESILALDVLHPGNRLTFTLDPETRDLKEMELYIHPGNQVVYRRVDAETFEYEEIVTPGDWKRRLVSGTITGSFYRSAMDAGLGDQDAAGIVELFDGALNFSREIQTGDRFEVVLAEQFVDGERTGQSHIEGVRIFNRKLTYTAFLFDDGNYYDQDGGSLASAFLRYPYRGSRRVTSAFSPKRTHPVTGRVTRHSGTDFSMPTGTQVLSTGDGVVTRVKEHPYAGKYIEIQHSGRYVTRYLHLSQILVKQGQKVKRGEVIAKSGNTGRTTAPHLHFELIVNGSPVDPVTAKIPVASAVPESRRLEFDGQCSALIALMEQPARQLARQTARSSAWAAPPLLAAEK